MAHENAFILTANPNPSNGIVTLSFAGIRDAQVEVIDAVGRVVYRGTSARDAFTWRGTAQDGLAASGIYMVRVTGKNSVGRAVQAQMPVSITR